VTEDGTPVDAVKPQVFDCLARAYRRGCATITPQGLDTFDRYHLCQYRDVFLSFDWHAATVLQS
jgi:hypothetical protein